jgi:hypothetical protein
MNNLLFTIAFLIAGLYCQAQKLAVATTVDKESILIGEQFTLTIQAENLPSGAQWITIDTLPHFEILERSKIDSTITGNTFTLKQSFKLTSWDSGSWQLLSAPPSGLAGNKPIKINVGHSPMDYTQDYHDVRDILDVEKPGRTTWYWYLIGLLLVLILFLLFFPRGKKKVLEFVPDATIYQQSLKKLNALKARSSDEPKAFYTELVAIFREYLVKRKGIQSYSKTTDDLAVQLGLLALPKNVFQPMLQALRLSDLAKFARAAPSPSENERSIEIIKQSINVIEESA